MTTLIELAERCEAALGPSIKLNNEIMTATGVQCLAPHGFTHSLDAAMMLVSNGWLPLLDSTDAEENRHHAELFPEGDIPTATACAKTLPLAICAAALRARAAQGIEAATAAETVELGSVHESPVGLGRCAQTAPKGAI